MNPYDAPQHTGRLTATQRLNRSDVLSYGLYVLTVVGVLSLAYLPIRYPRLADLSNGPFYYWPDDLFRTLLPVVCFLGLFSVLVFFARYYKKRRSTVGSK